MSNRIHEGSIRDDIAAHSGDSKKQLRDFSNELFDILRQNLLADGHIRLHQFGSFKLKWTKERTGKNPQTGEAIIIPAHPRITFTATKALKDKVSAGEINAMDSQINKKEPLTEVINNNMPIKEKPLNKQDQKKFVNVEPYLRKNLPPTLNPEAKRNFPTSLVAAVLLSTLVIYFANKDTSIKDTNYVAQTNVTEASSSTVSPVQPEPTTRHVKQTNSIEIKAAEKSLAETKPAQIIESTAILLTKTKTTKKSLSETGSLIQEEETKQYLAATDQLIKTKTIQNKNDAFFKQRDHKLVNGDSLWRLSRKNYINPFFWPHIYHANRYKIHNPNKLFIGKSISLPTLFGDPENLNAEDRRNIAEGYFLVYLHHKKSNNPFPYYALLGAEKFDPQVIKDHAYDIDEEDWNNLQIASN